jgi:hypothetical protein
MYLDNAQAAKTRLDGTIMPRLESGPVPLTDQQARWWTDTSKDGHAENRRLRAAAVRIVGNLDIGILRASIEYVIGRHESLRTRLTLVRGSPEQLVEGTNGTALEVVDLTDIAPAHLDQEARSNARQFFDEKVDLLVGPLFAYRLLRLSETTHVLLFGLEHMVSDGVSCGILTREVWTVYSQLAQNTQITLPTLPIQFADYAVWLRETLPLRKDRHEAFWLDRMSDTPKIELPLSSKSFLPKGPAMVMNGPLGKTLSAGLRSTAQREKTLFPLVIFSVYLLSLSRWCGQQDVVMLFASNARQRRPELHNMIGYLAHALYFRISELNARTLRELLAYVHKEFFAITSHQEFIVPLPQECNPCLMFNWGGLSTYSARWSSNQQHSAIPGLRLQPFNCEEDSEATFYPFFSDTPCGVVFTVHYRPDQIPTSSIERLVRDMRVLGHKMLENPHTEISSLPPFE